MCGAVEAYCILRPEVLCHVTVCAAELQLLLPSHTSGEVSRVSLRGLWLEAGSS